MIIKPAGLFGSDRSAGGVRDPTAHRSRDRGRRDLVGRSRSPPIACLMPTTLIWLRG